MFFNEMVGKFETLISVFRAFAADFAEEERERDRKEAEAKDIEHNKMFKDAFERIKQVLSIECILKSFTIYIFLQNIHLFLL